jgi:hydrogenase/urease accessory protein HupE
MGPVYDGIGHFLLTPEDFLPVVACAMFCGLRDTAACRFCLFMLPLIWITGGVIGQTAGFAPIPQWPALSFILFGLLVASDVRLPIGLFTLLVILFGLVHGYHNGVALKDGPGFYGLLGIASALFVMVALLSAGVLSLRPGWTRIVIRVAGSWIAAMGILLVGWHFSGAA